MDKLNLAGTWDKVEAMKKLLKDSWQCVKASYTKLDDEISLSTLRKTVVSLLKKIVLGSKKKMISTKNSAATNGRKI